MAAGTFVAGASIELSAGAHPGALRCVSARGLSYSHGKLALTRALEDMKKEACCGQSSMGFIPPRQVHTLARGISFA